MNRRSFVFLSAGAVVAETDLARRGESLLGAAARASSPRARSPHVLQLRLDADPDFAKTCCGPGKVYVTDLAHRTRFTSLDWSSDGILNVQLPAREPAAVHAHIGVPEFGRVWVTLDNQGAGYTDGTREPLAVLEEAVKSRLTRCARRLKETSLVSPPMRHFDLARELSANGKFAEALREGILAGEEIELAHAQAQLRSRGASPNARISATLFGERLGPLSIGVGYDWPMGNAPPDFLLPREVWTKLAHFIDGTTIPNFWRWIEPERKQYNWKPLDEIVDFSARQGIAVKSFTLYWGGIGGTPAWFRHLRFDEQKAAIEEWCRVIIGRYRGQISAWETVNEMHDWWFANRMRWTHEQILDVTRMVNELTGALDPGTPRVINNCCIWGEYLQGLNEHSWVPRTYLEELIGEGVRFEGIGLQYYNPGRDLMECAAHLDRFGSLKKPIWVTEMGTPSAAYSTRVETAQIDPLDGWRGPWTETLQANWCEYWYTMALSRPFLQALNWWDAVDSRAFVYKAGLLDDDLKPKPAFDRLEGVCLKWKVGKSRRSNPGIGLISEGVPPAVPGRQ